MLEIAVIKDKNSLAALDDILKKSFSKNTYQGYKTDLNQLQKVTGLSIFEINENDVLTYFNSLKEKYSNNAINRKISALSSVLNKLVALGLIKDNAVIKAKCLNKNMNLKSQISFKPLEENEIRNLILNGKDIRMSLIIEFLANTGCRVSEMINIERKDVKLAGEDVLIKVTGKGCKERKITITKNLYDKINVTFKDVMAHDMTSEMSYGIDFLFVTKSGKKYDRKNLWKQLKRLCEKILHRSDIHPHSFRHFVGTKLNEKYGLDFTSHYLGHSDISVTAKYYVHSDYSKIKPVLVTV